MERTDCTAVSRHQLEVDGGASRFVIHEFSIGRPAGRSLYGGIIRQALGTAAGRRHHPEITLPATIRNEGNESPVRRPAWIVVVAHVIGKLACLACGDIDDPDVLRTGPV